MPSSSSSSSIDLTPYLPPIGTLTREELSDLLESDTFHSVLDTAFIPGYSSTTNLRHYSFVSHSIKKMKQELDRFERERDDLFEELHGSPRFVQCMNPILRQYRLLQQRNARHHPYSRPHSPANSSSSPGSQRSVTILPADVNALFIPLAPAAPTSPIPTSSSSSYHTATEQLGTQANPIIIDDDEDVPVCARCDQQGHSRSNCNTPLRSFTHCLICDWTKQQTCDHFDIPPAWIKIQQEIIARRST